MNQCNKYIAINLDDKDYEDIIEESFKEIFE